MPDHFYTTEPNGEIAPVVGYISEGITGYVFTSAQSDTVPVYRFFHGGSGDHFYTQDSNGELALQIGYNAEGQAFHLYRDQKPGTTALHRWFGNGDHFYTTDPNGEAAPNVGYSPEGVLGYIYPEQHPGTTALKRWWNQPTYELINGTTLKTLAYSKETGQNRETQLSLDNCLEVTGGPKLTAKEAPDDNHNPVDDGRDTLGVAYAQGNISLHITGGTNIHMRRETHKLWTSVDDIDCDVGPWLRRTWDGHIEFVHPNRDKSWDWFTKTVKNVSDANRSPAEAIADLTVELLESQGIRGALAQWMLGTYLDNGNLIRRGS